MQDKNAVKIPAISGEQFEKGLRELEEISGGNIVVHSGTYGDGLTYFLGLDLVERSKGFICYYTPAGYVFRTEDERRKYAGTDFHDIEEAYGYVLHHAKLMVAGMSKSQLRYEFASVDEIVKSGFEAMEAL
jgi:hypothetical protein